MTKNLSLHAETHLKVLRVLESTPNINQRKLAESLGVSLGKTNFCLKALLEKGMVKMENFRTSTRKLNYTYLLTPSGIAEKAALTQHFLKRKMEEYDALKAEIELLKQESSGN
jgi:EPS-associated MarR family transcriptional regulator